MDDPLIELVGQGKKFATVQDLAKGKLESDAFIEQLKTEQAALRKELADKEEKAKEAATLKDLMDKLNAKKPDSNGKDGTAQLTQEELLQLVLKTLNEQKQSEIVKTNKDKANEVLLAKFQGDAEKAKTYKESKAKELGLTLESLDKLSENSPVAFTQLLGLQGQVTQPRAPSSVQSTNEGFFNTGQDKNEAYYSDLRKKDSKKFWSPSVQQELFKYGKEHGHEALTKILYG